MINDRQPLLFVDINLGSGFSERLVIHEHDSAKELAQTFCQKHGIKEKIKHKLLQQML